MTNFDLLCLTLGIMIGFGLIVAAIGYYWIAQDEGWFKK